MLTVATAVLTMSVLFSLFTLPVSASTKQLSSGNTGVSVKIADTVRKDSVDEYYAAYLFVSNSLRQIGIYDVNTWLKETNIYINSDFTAVEYLDRLFCSIAFNTKTSRMNNETYVKTVYRIVLNRLPTSAELNQALKFMKVRTSDHVLVNGFILERAYVANAFSLAYPELEYGDAYDPDMIWNMW